MGESGDGDGSECPDRAEEIALTGAFTPLKPNTFFACKGAASDNLRRNNWNSCRIVDGNCSSFGVNVTVELVVDVVVAAKKSVNCCPKRVFWLTRRFSKKSRKWRT